MHESPKAPESGLFERINDIRLKSIKGGSETRVAFSEGVKNFNVELENEYTRAELWKIPTWHMFIGSSQQTEDFGKSEYEAEVNKKIELFLNSFASEWL